MSDKYVIKNCPAITTGWHDSDYICNTHKMGCEHCKDCTDCVMKQIVEKCKLFQNNYLVNDGVQLLTTNILNSLDIEEAE